MAQRNVPSKEPATKAAGPYGHPLIRADGGTGTDGSMSIGMIVLSVVALVALSVSGSWVGR